MQIEKSKQINKEISIMDKKFGKTVMVKLTFKEMGSRFIGLC